MEKPRSLWFFYSILISPQITIINRFWIAYKKISLKFSNFFHSYLYNFSPFFSLLLIKQVSWDVDMAISFFIFGVCMFHSSQPMKENGYSLHLVWYVLYITSRSIEIAAGTVEPAPTTTTLHLFSQPLHASPLQRSLFFLLLSSIFGSHWQDNCLGVLAGAVVVDANSPLKRILWSYISDQVSLWLKSHFDRKFNFSTANMLALNVVVRRKLKAAPTIIFARIEAVVVVLVLLNIKSNDVGYILCIGDCCQIIQYQHKC